MSRRWLTLYEAVTRVDAEVPAAPGEDRATDEMIRAAVATGDLGARGVGVDAHTLMVRDDVLSAWITRLRRSG